MRLTPLWPQWLAAFEVSLLALLITTSLRWNTSFVETRSTHYELRTWVELLISFSKLLGIFLGTIITSLIGASITIYICGIFCLANSLCLIFANISELIITEITLGMFICACPIYIGEISNPRIRGKLVSLIIQGAITGNLFGNLARDYLKPGSLGTICLVISILFLASFLFFPPTPYYLMSRGKNHQAWKSIKWYNHESDGRDEVENLITFFEANPLMPFFKTIRKLFTPVNQRIFLLFIIVFTLQKLGGLFVILLRIEVLFENAHITIINPHKMVIIVGAITTIVSWMFFYMSDLFKRTDTILIGCGAMSAATFSWGLGYQLLELGYSEQSFQWLVLFSATAYQITINIIYLPVTFMIMSELFSPNTKIIAICLCNIVSSPSLFVTTKYFDFLAYYLTYKFTFYLFSLITMILGIFYSIYIPETKGKSLKEIQAILNYEKLSLELIVIEPNNSVKLNTN